MLKTKQLEHKLIENARRDLIQVKELLEFNPLVIADIGANIGYYAQTLLTLFSDAAIHSYEPHPDNLHYLNQIKHERLTIHPYGLYTSDTEIEIGMRSDNNNGTYSIFNSNNPTTVQFKNANNELIRPDFIKMDIEGSETFVLQCTEFLSQTRAIMIEMVYMDDFNQNKMISTQLEDLGFSKKIKITKNDYLWLR
jgi:FkbM family methyltransferase